MIRETTSRRRRRSRSASPGRSKRHKSRSRDRRGRDVAPAAAAPPPLMREPPDRFIDPALARQRERERERERERSGRGSRDERRVTRSRERDMAGRHGGSNTLTSSSGGLRGGGGREREVHIRSEMTHMDMVPDYRGGGGGGGGGMIPVRGGMPLISGHMTPAYLNGGGGRVNMGRGGVPDFGAVVEYPGGHGGMVVNGHGRGGYPLAPGGARGRSGDRNRERDRERALAIERERARDREREREREKERVLLREREERARLRELKAIEDRRASEAHALRRENRMREEAALKTARGRDTGRDAGRHAVAAAAPAVHAADRDRERERAPAPRGARVRELREGRDGRGRDRPPAAGRISKKGLFMTKPEIDDLFLKVLKKMGEDNSRFPCTASLINDRMKAENAGYNVANSEYLRFSHVLARFEADKVVGTSKANDSLQVNWTKFSAPDTGTGARRPDARRDADDMRVKIRASRVRGTLHLYFCSAEEDTMEGPAKDASATNGSGGRGDGGDDGNGGGDGDATGGDLVLSATPYAEIASILQARGEVLMASAPGPKNAEEGAAAEAATAVAATEADGDPTDDVATGAGSATEIPAAGDDDSANKGDDGKADNRDGGKDSTAAGDVKQGKEEEEAEEEVDKKEAVVQQDQKEEAGGASNGDGVQVSTETKLREDETKADDIEVYRRDMGWLRSANGMVAEVSIPSHGVGYKIAIMIHQRCKPCLCLFNKSVRKSADGHHTATPELSRMITGDRNIDIHEYSDVSQIGAIVDSWIEKRFPNKRPNARRARGVRGDSRGSRDRLSGNRADNGVGGDVLGKRDKLERDGEQDPDKDADGRRGARSKNNDDDGGGGGGDDDADTEGRSAVEGAGGVGELASGERTESVVSYDDGDNDEHEEVEDITGEYAMGAATSDVGDEGVGGEMMGDDEEIVSNDGSAQ